jgi:diaminopimelate epimerase
MKITKMQGTGNDFLIFNALIANDKSSDHESLNKSNRIDIVKKLCHRRTSIGADGFVFIDPPEKAEHDFKWDFYNSDGSQAEMCGNAARCVALYAFKNNFSDKTKVTFSTLSGTISATLEDNDLVKVQMTPVTNTLWDQSLEIENNHIDYAFIDSGVPHTVIELEDFQTDNSLRELSRKIQNADVFKPLSTNVTYISTINGRNGSLKIKSASFERGVSDFTLACGTGAVAAAFYKAHKEQLKQTSISVQVPGGELTVKIDGQNTYLIGPAKFIADIELYPF